MDDSEEALNQNPDPIRPENFLVIRENYFVHEESPVFPPIHHEDLPVGSVSIASDQSESSELSESSSAPTTSDLRWRAVVGEAILRSCEMFKAKVVSGIVGFGSYAVRLCSVFPVTAMAAVLVILVFLLKMKMKLRLPWRPRSVAVSRDNEDRLVLLLQHKDEKISQLLLQIAEMNETLSARRKVPVVRIK
ncbi:uncharacterized protein LOC120079493 [Benincasa hispida]|uniref:uncharacterized protein LOC120079493 n=1 Tax=Benincasa hispida TaxID=102211 RepID=UPI0019025892|nr:uncharacterized protein LOC120079493 [Benincasa hispida]